jgi:hypothetical protein
MQAEKQSGAGAASRSQRCPDDDTGLKLPAGFCATVFADGIGHARHMVVAPNGVLYINTWSGRYYGNDTPHAGGFLVALQGKNGQGKNGSEKADEIERFGETVQSGGHGGTGIGMYKGSIYAESNDRIVRYVLPAGSIVPNGSSETIVSGLPLGGDHPMHPFIIATQAISQSHAADGRGATYPRPNISARSVYMELEPFRSTPLNQPEAFTEQLIGPSAGHWEATL